MPEKVNLDNIELFNDKLINLKQEFFDAIHPVGETYTQYPQQDDPNTLYNRNGVTCQWEKVNYSGAFFRAEGGNANPYITKTDVLSIQGDLVKSHTHTQQGTFGSGGPSTDSTGSGGVDHTHSISHSHNVSASLTNGVGFRVEVTNAGFVALPAGQFGSGGPGGAGVSGSTSDISTSASGGATAYSHTHSLSNHTHSTTISGQTSSNDSGATETRPKNYTYIIWKRIA